MAGYDSKYDGNVYRKARLKAAEHNRNLLTMAGAAEDIPGVTEESLKRYENDITRPPCDAVRLMIDSYNAPELGPWYCANECPLGRSSREVPEQPAERAVMRLGNSIRSATEDMYRLAEIMEDGQISPEQEPDTAEIMEGLLELRRRTDETLAALEKARKAGKF